MSPDYDFSVSKFAAHHVEALLKNNRGAILPRSFHHSDKLACNRINPEFAIFATVVLNGKAALSASCLRNDIAPALSFPELPRPAS